MTPISKLVATAALLFMASISAPLAQDTAPILLEQRVQNTYVQGRQAMAAGDLLMASRAFRAILNIAPDHIPARRGLVDILIAAGEFEAAEYHLGLLIKSDSDTQAVSRYYAAQDRIVRETPFSLTGSFAVLPSTNINQGTRILRFGIWAPADDELETSGYGLRLGANTSYRKSLGQGQQVELQGSLTANLYTIETLQNLSGTVALQYQREAQTTSLSVGPYIRRTWYAPVENPDKNPDSYAIGASMSYALNLNPADKVSFTARYEYQEHFATNPLGNYKSGPYASANVRFDHKINSSLGTFASIGMQRFAPPLSGHLAYTGLSLTAGLNKQWTPTLSTGLTIGPGGRQYDAVSFYGYARRDDYYSIGASVRNANLKMFGVIPQISCTYRRNASNIANYDYRATDCQLVLIRSF